MGSKIVVQTPRSRRERPAKSALSRQVIVETSLEILQTEGLSKVTMRRIAIALDTGPASLYVYVRDTEDLHAQMLDVLLAPLAHSGAAEGSWRDRLKQLLTSYLRVLFDHPEIARMAMSTQPSGPNYLGLLDRLLALLEEGGVSDRDAAWAVDLLLLNATAKAVEHSAWDASPRHANEFSALTTAISNVDARQHPHIARLGGELISGGPDRFQWGLDVLINGVLHTPRAFIAEGEST